MKFNKVTLENGLTVLHEKRDVPVTAVMLAAKYGGSYETAKEKGLAHFIEHLCFKGTKKRSAKEIAYEVEKVGGELNAFTGEGKTVYYAKLPSQELRLAMDVIFDIYFNSVFPAKEVKKEANVICEEIKRFRDNPSSYVFHQIKSCLYKEPFGMFIAGTEENVRSKTKKQLLGRHREIYVPKNSILAVVGNNDLEQIVELAEKFSVSREGKTPKAPKIKTHVLNKKEKRSGIQQAKVALGFHFPRQGKKLYASSIFSAILGGGMSSKLFTEVREKRGLAYAVSSSYCSGKDYGYLIIHIGTDKAKVDEAIKVSIDEFKKMKDISKDELEDTKRQLIGNYHVGCEGSDDVAVTLISKEISGKAENFYRYEEKVNDISLEDVVKLSERSEYASFVLTP